MIIRLKSLEHDGKELDSKRTKHIEVHHFFIQKKNHKKCRLNVTQQRMWEYVFANLLQQMRVILMNCLIDFDDDEHGSTTLPLTSSNLLRPTLPTWRVPSEHRDLLGTQ